MGRVDARAYWSGVAPRKAFGHPFREQAFAALVPRETPVLDLGCGQGRLTAELGARGWADVVGADTSAGMIAEARARHPTKSWRVLEPGALPFEDASFGAVVLFTVLTCTPGDADLELLVSEIRRVLADEGIVYVSDMELQDDERNRQRYAAGVHQTPESALQWLIEDSQGRLGRSSREAWELACQVWPSLQGHDVEVID